MVRQAATIRCACEGFTLVELLVVLVVIGILSAIVLPSMVGLFTAGADAQAHNVLAGQLAAARSLAIQHRTRAGVHAQMSDISGAFTGKMPIACFTAVMVEVLDDPTKPSGSKHFVLAEGFFPQKIPGQMAFGRVDSNFYTATGYEPNQLTGDARWWFTSLTFVFDPNGQLAGGVTVFEPTAPSATKDPVFVDPNSRAYLWNPNVAKDANCNTSVIAAVMFDWAKFVSFASGDDRKTYLEKYGQTIAINRYTGAVLKEAGP